jgi:hypothetical protein
MKKAKANYLPRLTKGLTFYEGTLRKAIDAGEWDTVSSAVKEKVCMHGKKCVTHCDCHSVLAQCVCCPCAHK